MLIGYKNSYSRKVNNYSGDKQIVNQKLSLDFNNLKK